MFEDRMDLTVTEFLKRHAEEEQASFHMPGHKGSRFFRDLGYGHEIGSLVDGDITEVPGADNLFQPEGIIRNLMNRYKTMYGCRESMILINGSSAGIIGAVLATVQPGEKMILGSNCHKSVISGLTLAGGRPVYINPEPVKDWDLAGEISIESVRQAMDENPDAKVVFITSPNYYGICSPIGEIAEEVHSRGGVLIVDQAHGAHLKLMADLGLIGSMDGESLGADVVINSTHKTMASFTQTAVLNLCSDRVSRDLLAEKLQLVESTSPSYVFMKSMDLNADIVEKRGPELLKSWLKNTENFLQEAEAIPGLKILKHPRLDMTKLNLDMTALGLSGADLEEKLMEKGLFMELSTGNLTMALTGIGNSSQDYEKLLKALREISAECEWARPEGASEKISVADLYQKGGASEAIPKERERVFAEDAVGRVCAVAIVPYPPGIPLINPGQIIEEEALNYAVRLRQSGHKIMGIDEEGYLFCGKVNR